jgi:hypothetical protein
MSPPRRIGAYVTSQDLKAGEFFASTQLRAGVDIGVRGERRTLRRENAMYANGDTMST